MNWYSLNPLNFESKSSLKFKSGKFEFKKSLKFKFYKFVKFENKSSLKFKFYKSVKFEFKRSLKFKIYKSVKFNFKKIRRILHKKFKFSIDLQTANAPYSASHNLLPTHIFPSYTTKIYLNSMKKKSLRWKWDLLDAIYCRPVARSFQYFHILNRSPSLRLSIMFLFQVSVGDNWKKLHYIIEKRRKFLYFWQ